MIVFGEPGLDEQHTELQLRHRLRQERAAQDAPRPCAYSGRPPSSRAQSRTRRRRDPSAL
jgi:hypothetical protein